jgi:cytidylate kinase
MTTRVRRRRIVVAIDGPAGAGKSTVSKRLAAELGYRLLDTGALYRSVALVARKRGVAWDAEAALAEIALDLDVTFRMEDGVNHVFVEGQDVSRAIRTPEISSGASQVSALPAVRAALMDLQRQLGAEGGVIAEGRDVGTVVFPNAGAKFFLTASAEARAQRRFLELEDRGEKANLAATRRDMDERDARDSGRAVAPLTKATDAVAVESSAMGIEDVVAYMRRIIRTRERGPRK